MKDVISLTKRLLSFNTIDPPGNEEEMANYAGDLLAGFGFNVRYPEYSERRVHLIAEKGLTNISSPIVLSGHLDTVSAERSLWTYNPFGGDIKDGRIYGRGSSDMKGALAAMMIAAIRSFEDADPDGGIRLIFTAGEEAGCLGIKDMLRRGTDFGNARAIIVGEPTSNLPAVAHKGALYLNCKATGKTAHSSMPELGINAIYKAVRSIEKIMKFDFEEEPDILLGYPTINVGKIHGGTNINTVPESAEFTIDIRTTTASFHDEILKKLYMAIGNEVSIETLVNLKPLSTPFDDPFVQLVHKKCGIDTSDSRFPYSLPYLTDASVLQEIYPGIPAVILGPGEKSMAHRNDEFCYIEKLERAVDIYKDLIIKSGNYNE